MLQAVTSADARCLTSLTSLAYGTDVHGLALPLQDGALPERQRCSDLSSRLASSWPPVGAAAAFVVAGALGSLSRDCAGNLVNREVGAPNFCKKTVTLPEGTQQSTSYLLPAERFLESSCKVSTRCDFFFRKRKEGLLLV